VYYSLVVAMARAPDQLEKILGPLESEVVRAVWRLVGHDVRHPQPRHGVQGLGTKEAAQSVEELQADGHRVARDLMIAHRETIAQAEGGGAVRA
jgi:hypothetical protein